MVVASGTACFRILVSALDIALEASETEGPQFRMDITGALQDGYRPLLAVEVEELGVTYLRPACTRSGS